MGTVLMFLGFFILTIAFGFAFYIGFYVVYNMYKMGRYGFIPLLILLGIILVLVGNLI